MRNHIEKGEVKISINLTSEIKLRILAFVSYFSVELSTFIDSGLCVECASSTPTPPIQQQLRSVRCCGIYGSGEIKSPWSILSVRWFVFWGYTNYIQATMFRVKHFVYFNLTAHPVESESIWLTINWSNGRNRCTCKSIEQHSKSRLDRI